MPPETGQPIVWVPDHPYNQLPSMPPEHDLEPTEVLRRCVQARSALAELKVSAEYLPNPTILVNTIPLLEAQASSEIENIVTTADTLFRFMQLDERADDATREAMRYRHAVMEAFSTLGSLPICTRMAEQVCSRIKGVDMSVRQTPGTQLQNRATGEIIYTPPESEHRLRRLLANWESFVHGDLAPGLDPLVRMAVSHYQFEAIHPFTDGNGRTGRVLNTLLLVEHRLLATPIFYLSRYIIANKSE